MDNSQQHIIVGTAGHVDHGKTELTAALTGVNTAHLPEEKKRGMTIVPGFVPLTLPNGLRLGLIDVPGHEKFVKNMLAGVAGIDMVMLVIAADEGVMPQTVEHLHILHLLGVDKGVAVITKADLADGPEWLEMIREQIKDLLAGTTLADAPIVTTSAYTGEGLDELRQVLMEVAASVDRKPVSGHARLPIDRVFTKTGFGTVVTGTLWSGTLSEGQSVELWPAGREARIRSIQIHGEKAPRAMAGQRTAVNLSGVEAADSPRGGWLAEPGLLRETYRVDVSLRLLATARPLSQRTRVRIHHGTSEALGRVNLLDCEELAPGGECFAQLELETPLPPLTGDRIVLRSYSPMETIAGCTVLDANPIKHKHNDARVIEALTARTKGSESDLLAQVLTREARPLTLNAAAKAAQAPAEEIGPLLAEVEADGRALPLDIDGERSWLAAESAADILSRLQSDLAEYHQKYPLRGGFPLAEIKGRYCGGFSQKQVNALLAYWQDRGELGRAKGLIHAAGFAPHISEKQRAALDALTAAYEGALFMPPEWNEACAAAGVRPENAAELRTHLLEQGLLISSGDYLFSAQAPAEAAARLRQAAADYPEGFAAGDIRELLGSNRKYTLALLEYTDARKLTVRVGDKRFCGEEKEA
ncbi:MAG: selenocysteine-specific translation elongation factor [Firmicutes bacterium]|nr:selenocysteine-specific translation elongation factor [Bacillota bacterium]